MSATGARSRSPATARPVPTPDAWQPLPWEAWGDTLATVHLWTQVVGKLRMAAAPPVNHWWHATLYVTSRGLGTSSVPYGQRLFSIDFDFVDHRVVVADSDGRSFVMTLEPMSVADFYAGLMAGLRSLGIDLRIHTMPSEIADAIRFEADTSHASYERDHAHALWRSLVDAQRVLQAFRARFTGKVSPVHFFWGSFDLAVTRFSGRRAPLHPGGIPNCPDWVMEEAYSHEVSSAGWWPGNADVSPRFYSYMYPEPAGFSTAPVEPMAASYSLEFGQFVLPYKALRDTSDPDASVDAFLTSTYRAGADLAGWDQSALESSSYPLERPPRQAWSTSLEQTGFRGATERLPVGDIDKCRHQQGDLFPAPHARSATSR